MEENKKDNLKSLKFSWDKYLRINIGIIWASIVIGSTFFLFCFVGEQLPTESAQMRFRHKILLHAIRIDNIFCFGKISGQKWRMSAAQWDYRDFEMAQI